MVQEFNVVSCYTCTTFQVEQVKKSNKWICKLCNEKQSLKQVFFQGNGKDCRLNCQMLNMKRQETDTSVHHFYLEQDTKDEVCNKENSLCIPLKEEGKETNGSKWTQYIEEDLTAEDCENEEKLSTIPVCLRGEHDVRKTKRSSSYDSHGTAKRRKELHYLSIQQHQLIDESGFNPLTQLSHLANESGCDNELNQDTIQTSFRYDELRKSSVRLCNTDTLVFLKTDMKMTSMPRTCERDANLVSNRTEITQFSRKKKVEIDKDDNDRRTQPLSTSKWNNFLTVEAEEKEGSDQEENDTTDFR